MYILTIIVGKETFFITNSDTRRKRLHGVAQNENRARKISSFAYPAQVEGNPVIRFFTAPVLQHGQNSKKEIIDVIALLLDFQAIQK